jgi:hypothetical protein
MLLFKTLVALSSVETQSVIWTVQHMLILFRFKGLPFHRT